MTSLHERFLGTFRAPRHEPVPLNRALDEGATRDIERIYEELKENETGFPYGFCDKASSKLLKLGFKRIRGSFRLDRDFDGWSSPWAYHSWSVDSSGVIIDLTLSQFNEYMNTGVENGVQIITKENPLFERFTPFENQRLSNIPVE